MERVFGYKCPPEDDHFQVLHEIDLFLRTIAKEVQATGEQRDGLESALSRATVPA